jgi:hypothetical protein
METTYPLETDAENIGETALRLVGQLVEQRHAAADVIDALLALVYSDNAAPRIGEDAYDEATQFALLLRDDFENEGWRSEPTASEILPLIVAGVTD